MIRVTIELIPYGFGKPRTIGVAEIANDGTSDDPNVGSYNFMIRDKRTWNRSGEIHDFPRKRLNVWYLLARCLKESGIQ